MNPEEHLDPIAEHYKNEHKNEVTLFAATNFRNQLRRFGIKTDDRRRHMYVIGKTGTGKTTFLSNLMYQDIQNGHGMALVDPHGEFAEEVIGFVPEHRLKDVIYINPADIDFPVGFNVLEWKKEEQKYLIGAGLMGVFKKIWPDVWSARMEHIMNNCILALLDYPNSTLLGINRILQDRDYRKLVINAVKDPVVKSFWLHEFERWEPKFQKEAIAPIQNKVGQFLSSTLIRNIVAQTKSTFDIREAMDKSKIVIINLSKGRIGEEASRLLGGMLITKIQLAAMERVDMAEKDRRDFYLFVDEFQNFATESFANILSEARKYRLNLVVAHQYIEQLEEEVAAAVFGNVGTIVSFRVGSKDAEFMEPEFAPDFVIEDLVNIPNHQIYLKLMIDGVTSKPFSANTLPPLSKPNRENVIKAVEASRKFYTRPRSEVEKEIVAWSESYVDESKKSLGLSSVSPSLGVRPLSKPPVPPALAKAKPVIAEPPKEVSLAAVLGKAAKVEPAAAGELAKAIKESGEFVGKVRIVKEEAPKAKPSPPPKPQNKPNIQQKPVIAKPTQVQGQKPKGPPPSQKNKNVLPWQGK